MAYRAFLSSLLIIYSMNSQAQELYNKLFFNSTKNIYIADFSGNKVSFQETNHMGGTGNPLDDVAEGIAHVEDKNGNVIIWVTANGVYDKNGDLMPGSSGIKANPSNTEINICPVPGNNGKYYIFYNEETCSNLYYSVVDLSIRNGLGDITQLNVQLDAGSFYGEGLEIISVPCSSNYKLIAYKCNLEFVEFSITSMGIGEPRMLLPYDTGNNEGRGELEYYKGNVGMAVANYNKAVLFKYNPYTDSASNLKEINFSSQAGVYGLQFSPDTQYVYFTDWFNVDVFEKPVYPNLFRYNLRNEEIKSWVIPYSNSNCGTAVGLGQIELGKDYKLYIPEVNGCGILVVSQPDNPDPVFQYENLNFPVSLGISDHITDLFIPADFSASISNEKVCKGDTIRFKFSNDYAVSINVTSGKLVKGKEPYLIANESTPVEILNVNPYGCIDTVKLNLEITNPGPVSITQNEIIKDCSIKTFLVANYKAGLNNIKWYKDSVLYASQKDTIDVNLEGRYYFSVANQCKYSSSQISVHPKIQIIEQVEISNLITPNGDDKNDTFENPYKTSNPFQFEVYNRWGALVYSDQNYQNNWGNTAEPGLYYFLLQDKDCSINEKGWIQVVR